MGGPDFGKVVIWGVGLMGGSLALALKKHKVAETVWGLGRNPDRLQAAKDQGIITHVAADPAEGAGDADIVVVSLPVDLIPDKVLAIAEKASSGTVLTDMGSAKGLIVERVESDLAKSGPAFVGSHPMCGSERSGFEAARADLFEGATCVVTPTSRTDSSALEKTKRFWERVGGRILELDPETHDRLAARTSHMPRVVASALCHALACEDESLRWDLMVATGFLGSTRTAASDESVWTQILLQNPDHLLTCLDDFGRTLEEFRDLIRSRDEESLRKWLQQAKKVRTELRSKEGSIEKRRIDQGGEDTCR